VERIKSFNIQATPTGRGSSQKLEVLVDEEINGWLDAHPEADNIRVSHAANPSTAFPTAFVILTYECRDMSAEPAEELIQPTPAEQAPEEPEQNRRRGRPPTKK
jgi:hypothetical protein